MQSPRRLTARPETPVGTGPFRLAATGPGRIELAAVDGHWAGTPRVKRVVFRRFADERALARALASGEADVTAALGPDRAAELRAGADVTLDAQAGLSLTYLAVNNERSPFSDAPVRRALSRAIDRARLVRELLAGHAEPAHAALPPILLGPDTRARELVLDRDAARRLLADAGVPPGFQTTLTVSRAPRPYLLEPLLAAARIRDDLARVGLVVRLREIPSWAEQVAITSRGDFELALLGWRADSLDPNDFLTALVDSGSIGATNRSRYRSAEMDGLLKRARQDRAPDCAALALPPGAGPGAERHAVRPALPFVGVHRLSPGAARSRDRPHRRAEVRQGMEATLTRGLLRSRRRRTRSSHFWAPASLPPPSSRPSRPSSWRSCARRSRPWTADSTASWACTSRTSRAGP